MDDNNENNNNIEVEEQEEENSNNNINNKKKVSKNPESKSLINGLTPNEFLNKLLEEHPDYTGVKAKQLKKELKK